MTLFQRKFGTLLVGLDWTSRLNVFRKSLEESHFAQSRVFRAVDLHGLHVAEALSMLEDALKEFVHQGVNTTQRSCPIPKIIAMVYSCMIISGQKIAYVIVGAGSHSNARHERVNDGKLRSAVESWLHEQQYTFREIAALGKKGTFFVSL